MSYRAPLPVAILIVAAALAGCAGGESADVPVVALFDQATGGLRGVVLQENELPLPDALVSVLEQAVAPVRTDELGRFELAFVRSGVQTLRAEAAGFLPQDVAIRVGAGTVAEGLLVKLVPLPTDRPYVLTQFHPEIISGASYKLTPACQYTPDLAPVPPPLPRALKTCGGTNALPPFQSCAEGTRCSWNLTDSLPPTWRTIQIEGNWRPTSAATGHSFYVDLAAPGYKPPFGYRQTDPEVWVDARSAPPLRIRVDDADFDDRGLDRETQWCCGWIVRVYPAQCDLSAAANRPPPEGQNCYEAATGPDAVVMLEQRIDLYFSLGAAGNLAEAYTALPTD